MKPVNRGLAHPPIAQVMTSLPKPEPKPAQPEAHKSEPVDIKALRLAEKLKAKQKLLSSGK
jgi:hypothetical protein